MRGSSWQARSIRVCRRRPARAGGMGARIACFRDVACTFSRRPNTPLWLPHFTSWHLHQKEPL
eukprot:1437137-Alexandrium_andersonii.AAC.1